jgi:hypothetical protein
MYLGKLENCLEIEGFNGIIPIDHLFSLLEGEFERQDIEEVIYNELRVVSSIFRNTSAAKKYNTPIFMVS